MTTHDIDIELPPLPPPFKKAVYATSANTKSVRDGVEMGGYEKEPPLFDDAQMHEYACAAVEAVLQSQDREDAERYRWLRRHWFTMTSSYQGDRVHFAINQPRYSNATERDVDAAIDHARRIEGEDHHTNRSQRNERIKHNRNPPAWRYVLI